MYPQSNSELRNIRSVHTITVLVSFIVSFTQATVSWEEGHSAKEWLRYGGPVSVSVGVGLDC